MANLPGPYEIEFELVGFVNPTRSHFVRVACAALGSPAPGTLPTAIDIQKKGGSTAKLDIVANQYWEFVRLFYSNAIQCSGYQFWRYVTGTFAKDFISSGALTNPACSGAGGQNAAQITLTFRSANGGIMKFVLLESNQTGDNRVALIPNAAGTPPQRVAAYMLSADGIQLARDDAYPVNALRDSRGQNERVWREIFR